MSTSTPFDQHHPIDSHAPTHATAHDVPHAAPRQCTNCDSPGAEVYCPRCGEKQPDHHDLTLGHFAHDVVHELVHLDSKLFGTMRALFVQPGHLTAEYFAGRKKRYIAPLRLFLTMFALQFIVYSFYKPAALYTVDSFSRFDATGNFDRMLTRLANKRGMPLEQYKERIDVKWQKAISFVQLLNVLAVALVFKLLHRRRHLVEHLVFSAHFLALSFALSLLVWPVYAAYGLQRGALQQTMSYATISLLLVYLYFAQRRFFGGTKGKTIVKTALAYGGVYLATIVLLGGALVYAFVVVR